MNPNLSYRPDIDGLRAVAVLAVLAGVLHQLSAPLEPGGDVSVAIRGCLITKIVAGEAHP